MSALRVVTTREGSQEPGDENFAAGSWTRSEEVRIINNAPYGAGVVHA